MKDIKNLLIATAAIALGFSISPFAFATTTSGACAMDVDGFGDYYVCKVVDNKDTWVNVKSDTTKAYLGGYPTADSVDEKCDSSSPISEDDKTITSGTLTNPVIFSEDSGTCFTLDGFDESWREGDGLD